MQQMQLPEYIDIELGNTFDTLESAIESEFEVPSNIDEIEYKSRDGFIPFTNGGVFLMASINLDYLTGSGKGFINKEVTETIDKTVDYCYTNAREQFIAENRDALNKLFTFEELDANTDEVNYHKLYDLNNGALAESLSEMESSWLDCTLFIEHRVQFYSADNHRNETGADEICFLSGVNTDYDYGRDKGLTITFEQTVKLGDLTPNIIKDITKKMLASI